MSLWYARGPVPIWPPVQNNVPGGNAMLQTINPDKAAQTGGMCTDRATCEMWNRGHYLDLKSKLPQWASAADLVPAVNLTSFTGYYWPPAKGGPVEPLWYNWTTQAPPGAPTLAPLTSTSAATTTTVVVVPDAASINPTGFTNCTCTNIINDTTTTIKTIVGSAGIASIITALVCLLGGFMEGLIFFGKKTDLVEDADEVGQLDGLSEEERFDLIIAE